MVRSYLEHVPAQAFGLICSAGSRSYYDGKLAYVPALEDVLVWDVKKGQMMAMWHEIGHRAEVTCIASSPRPNVFAVGYFDGSIRLWDSITGTVIITFNGHKKAVTALAFDHDGARLVSGSQDTDIILWDLVAETGMFRLRGHRDQITALSFLQTPPSDPSSSSIEPSATSPGYLLTTGKDTFLKLWDLSVQHCVETVVAHRSECWSMDVSEPDLLILTGSGEGEVKAWSLDADALREGLREGITGEPTASATEEANGAGEQEPSARTRRSRFLHLAGLLPTSNPSSTHRISQISFHSSRQFVAVQAQDRSVEVYRLRGEEEVKKKMARRKRREKEKKREKEAKKKKGKGKEDGAADQDGDEKMETEEGEDEREREVGWVDRITSYVIVRGSGRVRSFAFDPDKSIPKGGVHILLALANNAVEVYSVPAPPKGKAEKAAYTQQGLLEPVKAYGLDLPGHRADIRTLCLSSNDELLASASNGQLKVWNRHTTQCIRTLECGYAICSTFLPGDRHLVVGTKSGELHLYDVSSSTLLETIKAHEGPLWSVHVRPDGMQLVTGSGDKDVKFWEFEMREVERGEEEAELPATMQMTLVHVRTLKMTDDVLAVRYSPNGKLLAVSLLDSTVKVFYQDTLKFFLSLYGHKLPVLSMDISPDSRLIVTCSADKNVKIWGLDFGDCHKSIFAHEDSIMQVAFERRGFEDNSDLGSGKQTHYFWTVSKDKTVKYWDGDRFEQIQKLEGHQGEVWALAVSNRGAFVATGSHDKSVRIWEKTDNPLFLEEQRERELEELYEAGIADTQDRISGAQNGEGEEVTEVTKSTRETLMAGERIIEALELADEDRALMSAWEAEKAAMVSRGEEERAKRLARPARNAVFVAVEDVSAERYVLDVIEKVSSAALHDALLVLPFGKVVSLMEYLDIWANKEWSIALVSRILFFLLRTYHNQIVTNRVMRTTLVRVKGHLRATLAKQKEMIGYNLAALHYMKRRVEAAQTAEYFEADPLLSEEAVKQKIMEGGAKRKRKVVV